MTTQENTTQPAPEISKALGIDPKERVQLPQVDPVHLTGTTRFRGQLIDIPRNVPLARIRVFSRSHNLAVGSQPYAWTGRENLVPANKWTELIVYADQLPAIQNMVETDVEAVKRAKARYDRELAAWIKLGDAHGQRDAYCEGTFNNSVVGIFLADNGRSMKPLDACEVIEELPPAPSIEQQNLALASQATAGVGDGMAALAAQLQQQNTLLMKMVEKLTTPTKKDAA